MKKPKTDLLTYAELIEGKYSGSDNERAYIFLTAFDRYRQQLKTLDQLRAEIEACPEATVEKEYVKGRKNVVINPVISEYNKTSTAANGTAITLLKALKELQDETGTKDEDELVEFLRGKQ